MKHPPVFPNTTKCTGFDYDKNNRRTVTKYPNGVKNTTVFDNAGRTSSITATNTSGTALAKRAYTYTAGSTGKDGSLRKTMTTETGAVTTYDYDDLNRLEYATLGSVTESWTYDKNSNRTSATKTGQATLHSTYNTADQLCWTSTTAGTCGTVPASSRTYSYDANGNTTRNSNVTQGYNVFDQFTSSAVSGSGVTTSFSYAGLRNDERTKAGNTTFLNGSLGITTETTNGATTSFIRDPQGALISMRTSTGASYYYTTDALGSIILLTDTNQTKAATYTYDSWGNTTTTGTQANTNPWQYAGGYKDTETSYTKFGARYYDPTTGRFTQPDPSGQETNAYLYAGANPINNTDSSGLSWFGDFLGEATDFAISGGFGYLVTGAALPFLGPVGAGLLGAGVGGCLGGAAGEGASAAVDDEDYTLRDAALACGEGIVDGVFGGALDLLKS